MKKPLELALGKLKDALVRLEEGTAIAQTDLNKDGVIQRFEFTFELLWKALKIHFQDKGLDSRSPKDSLKVAFRVGFIKAVDEPLFLNMLEDRNISSHVYDKQAASAIFSRIRDIYLPAIKTLTKNLEKEVI